MLLKNKTKKQITGLLIESELQLENRNKSIADLIDQKEKLIHDNFNISKLVQDQKEAWITKSIENIADIKSIKDMLQPFIDETMTHREKKYLGRRVCGLCEKQLDRCG